jgi:hypothetical protein
MTWPEQMFPTNRRIEPPSRWAFYWSSGADFALTENYAHNGKNSKMNGNAREITASSYWLIAARFARPIAD